MLAIDLPDHRRSSERALLAALAARDPMALAEAYHRTSAAAYACARRLLGSQSEVEALLREVYAEMWTSPPTATALEGWVRSRCFAWGAAELRDRGAAPASSSMAALLDDLPAPQGAVHEPAEQILADLDADARLAVVRAHDRGVPSSEQAGPDPEHDLERGLIALAGAADASDPEPGRCGRTGLADWALGLLDPDSAADLAAHLTEDPDCAAIARRLQRGRRVLEGLPPTPDLGQRILVAVLAAAPPGSEAEQQLPSALDEPALADDQPAASADAAPAQAPRRPPRPRAARPDARGGRPALRVKAGRIPADAAAPSASSPPSAPAPPGPGAAAAGEPASGGRPAGRRRGAKALLIVGLLLLLAGLALGAVYLLDLGL